ncbi:MAG: polysaccharide deacetylase family protein [Oscillospiraceae bacterium]|nr:polysaccharide deacetylase family protein [Oscillospiraceae bacterium]
MKFKNKKIILLVFVIISLLNIVVSANSAPNLAENKNYSWYSVPVPENKQPNFDVNLDEIKKYGAYALGNKDDKVIYLTFDFGFENGNVKKCLDALNAYGVKGSFFILENVVKRNPELLKEIADSGHIIANHTMKHKNMCYITDFAEYEKEVTGLEKMYEEATGHKMSKYFRPPQGEFTKQNLEYNQKLGYKTIFWSLAYKDWDNNNQPDPDASIQKILKRTHNGAVVLLHPTSNTNAAILDTLIKEWKKLGYRFGTLDELTA